MRNNMSMAEKYYVIISMLRIVIRIFISYALRSRDENSVTSVRNENYDCAHILFSDVSLL